ncbi:hypothetical protein BD770DRAFT_442870 [Pilaira anomala]|nr:hypothetical protein BD770DRAFT_442870 [Pilaira anomala]
MRFAIISTFVLLLTHQVIARPAEGCLQTYTVTDADSCVSVAATFKITEPEFYAMNPGLHHSVKHDCDNLDTGKQYCICMKSPCALPHVVPAGLKDQNSTEKVMQTVPSGMNSTNVKPSSSFTATAILSSQSSSHSSAFSSGSHSSSAHKSSFPTASATMSNMTRSSGSMSASSQTASLKSSATIASALSAVSMGIVMTAASMMF